MQLALAFSLILSLMQPLAEIVPAETVRHRAETPVPPMNRTSVYFVYDGSKATYFSQLISLPFTKDELTYDTRGKAALAAARQRFMNSAESEDGAIVLSNNVYTVFQQSYQTAEQFEGERLRKIREKREGSSAVRIL